MNQLGTESGKECTRREALMDDFIEACEDYNVPVSWACAFSRRETHFQNVRSPAGATDDRRGGAWGPMQMTASTALDLGFRPSLTMQERGEAIGADANIGIDLGVQLLARLKKRFNGDLKKVACAYNAGPGAVINNKLTAGTLLYAKDVVQFALEYESLDDLADV